jgi:hypothetical protein
MMRLGIDFDNTLVRYDNLFHKIAYEQGWIGQSFPKSKTKIRDHLNKTGLADKFTEIQGEVYGSRIREAEPAAGVMRALKNIKEKQVPIYIVSHKTMYPYKGKPYNLHESAREWLKQNGFTNKKILGIKKEDIYFEESKQKKIERIHELKCTHYIDDLPEILEMLESSITKIHYNPDNDVTSSNNNWLKMDNWCKLEEILRPQ